MMSLLLSLFCCYSMYTKAGITKLPAGLSMVNMHSIFHVNLESTMMFVVIDIIFGLLILSPLTISFLFFLVFCLLFALVYQLNVLMFSETLSCIIFLSLFLLA